MEEKDVISQIISVFASRGRDNYGGEEVSQLEHALQAASLARADGASAALITAALLHDIGHILDEEETRQEPPSQGKSLDDAHEEKGYLWLRDHFGPEVSDPVRLHVAAKRYMCTVEPEYLSRLSPTSLQSYHDQGGSMSNEEVKAFESELHLEAALSVRRWDDAAKVVGMKIPTIEDFVPEIKATLSGKA